ncbi:MAG: T9SS type A sorting domain-containing protein [Cytophagales bacterium]|nr:T9SS type A sorting domain-containing protein [Cytophagales bacterium]
MNRIAITLFFIVCGFQTLGQLVVRPINRSNKTQASTAARQNALSLPFWDDFSFSGPAPDTTLWQTGVDVFVNNSLGINPPSINVATFDGARATGTPHNASSEEPGAADSLVSCPIDLSLVVPSKRSTVFLSFQYQIQGAGERPEEGDSITLFLLDSSNLWHEVWTVSGGEVFNSTNFAPESLQITDFQRDTIYFFHDQFQFKFVSYTSRRGIFDTWHIDYVYMNQDRAELVNERIFDRAAASIPGPLFGPYYHMPMSQYMDSSLFTQQEVVLNNLDIGAPHPFSYTQTLINTLADTSLRSDNFSNQLLFSGASDTFPGIGNISPNLLFADSLYVTSEFTFFTGDRNLFEEIGPSGDTLFLDVDLKVNDTVRSFHMLHETLAYDDGTAEFAAGINLDGGEVAVRYALFTPDTLTHLQVYFPPFSTSTGQAITLKVWSRLNETSLRAQQQFTIEAGDMRNAFAEIQLNVPIIVSDTFFIGYEQFTDDYIGIGLDRSNPQASDDLFFNVSQEWQQNQEIVGALMIRPIFQNTSDLVLNTPIEKEEAPIVLYPNPAKYELRSSVPFEHLQLFNLSGKLIFSSSYQPVINIQEIPNGIYLVKTHRKGAVETTKLIIQK